MIAVIGTLIIALMLWQHWSIHRKSKSANWEQTLKFYRRSMQAAVLATLLFIFGCAIVLIMDLSAEGGSRVLVKVEDFMDKNKGPLSVMCIAFFGGVLRLSAERAVGASSRLVDNLTDLYRSFFDRGRLSMESTIGKIAGGGFGQRQDAWFAWLCVTLVVAFVNTLPSLGDILFSSSTKKSPTEASANLVGLSIFATLYVAIGYFLWIYMVLFSKLTQEHHFTGRAARLFLGGILTDQIPRQCLLVGPPHSGKTYFSKPLGIEGGEPSQAGQNTGVTGRIDIRTGAINRRDPPEGPITIQLTTLDTPGENMGDHILLTSIFRADVLVFLLDVGMLDPEKMELTKNYSLSEWHNMISKSDQETVIQTKVNLQGFHLATNRTTHGSLIESRDLYKVQSFVLYLNKKSIDVYAGANTEGPNTAEIAERLREVQHCINRHSERWQTLARAIGERFGVAKENCCCIGGTAAANNGANLLALSTQEQLKAAPWPRNEEW